MRALAYLTAVLSLTAVAVALPADRPAPASVVSAAIVISQVYGGGGNTGAPYDSKFVELLNRSAVPVPVDGWSIQYASATGTANFSSNVLVLPSATLPPGGYFLVRLAGGTNGAPLPAADAVGTINPAAASGKLILASTSTGFVCNGGSTPCDAEQLGQVVDLVGYGSANFYEGSGAAPTLSNTTAALRLDGGCSDSDDNTADFTAGAPEPRNSQSPRQLCLEEPTPGATPTERATAVPTVAPTVTPTEPPAPTTAPTSFDFNGFLAPLANPPAVNSAKAGSSVVLHFSLGGDYGLEVIADGYPVSIRRGCGGGDDEATLPADNPGQSGLSFDAAMQVYTLVWKTDKAWAGSCRTLTLKLIDGSYHHAHFSFR